MTDKLRDKLLFAEENYDLDKQYPEPQYVREGIKNAFTEMSEELSLMIEDTRCSGSTFSGVVLFGNQLYPINLGDSRTMLIMRRGLDRQIKFGTQVSKQKEVTALYVADQITTDHNPMDQTEYGRIIESGGRIDPFRDKFGNPMGPLRVWFKDRNYPGLTMTRSLGDAHSKKIGCLSVPEVDYHKLRGNNVDQLELIEVGEESEEEKKDK